MRPEFHFTAASGWINDPHGITYRDGGYDAFFQYVPDSTDWAAGCHWGHARGKDLLSLAELPVAIAPGDGDGGIWTGSLITGDDDRTRVFYTSTSEPDIGMGRIRLATPDDEDWISWTKGPFVAEAPAELSLTTYRDPFVRKDPDGWRMFVGGGGADRTAMAVTYFSTDADTWQYEGVALQRSAAETDGVWMGALWECPQIFDVDGRAVMVSSVWEADVLHYAAYAIGTYAAGGFTATHWGRLTFGDSYYAPSFFRDSEGRPCLTFWMRGIADIAAGWAGAHSIPYVLSIEGEALVARPHPDLERYRGQSASGRVDGLAADVSWTPDDAGLQVECGDSELIALTRRGDLLAVVVNGQEWEVPYAGDVRVVVDGPVLEISSAGGLFGSPVAPAGAALLVRGAGAAPIAYALSR